MSGNASFDVDPQVLQGFLEESRDALAALDALFVLLEKNPADTNTISAIFRPVHSIKGNAPFFGLMRLKTIAHDFESLLAALRDKKVTGHKALFDLLLAGIDEMKAIVERVAAGQAEVSNEEAYAQLLKSAREAAAGTLKPPVEESSLRESIIKFQTWNLSAEQGAVREILLAALSTAPLVPQESAAQPLEKPKPTPDPAPANVARAEGPKSMRVPEERIDTFLGFVGELVIAQDMLRHFSSKFNGHSFDTSLARDLQVINNVIANLGSGLETAIMSIRKVPLRTLLQKVPRLIRDVAAARGKEIQVAIEGENLEIDKSLIELLDAPLTHMARNAADHGIEKPEVREERGKPRAGTVSVTCRENPTEFVLTIKDDGAGLNQEALQRKAITLGIIQEGQTLSESQIVDLIFMAGVSTAQEVSDVSGRGVGMDVVKRNVESAGGSISVASIPGKGCTFSLTLPKSVTTQIIQGYVVQIQQINFVLPLALVHEAWRLCDSKVSYVLEKGQQVQRHDATQLIVDLGAYLELSEKREMDPSQLIVSVNQKDHMLALMVDKIIGPRQVVLKPLDHRINRDGLYLGGALLGDGAVALVLDVDHLSN